MGKRANLLFFLSIVSAFLIDRLGKFLVRTTLPLGESTSIVKNFFSITYVQNQGIIFGLFPLKNSLVITLNIAVIFTVIVIWNRFYYKSKSAWVSTGMGLILGGELGNFLDRVTEGAVIDFLDFSFWPVFNWADLAICLGAAMIIWNIVRTGRSCAS